MSDVQLANIEALASGEGSSFSCGWEYGKDDHGCVHYVCIKDGKGNNCQCGDVDYK